MAKETTRTTSQRQFEITRKEFAAGLKSALGVEIPESASGILVKEHGTNAVTVHWTETTLIEPPKPPKAPTKSEGN